MKAFLLLLGLAACGQNGGPADGGNDAPLVVDAPLVDDGGSCSLPEYDAGGTTPECITTATFTCGADIYEVDCSCPSATCSCFKNGAKLKTLSYGACPTCSSTSFDDGGCDFPVSVSH